jgi:hypothetical protein
MTKQSFFIVPEKYGEQKDELADRLYPPRHPRFLIRDRSMVAAYPKAFLMAI